MSDDDQMLVQQFLDRMDDSDQADEKEDMTLLQRLADRAEGKGRKFLSDEEAQINALLWQQDRDEQALARLFVSSALLIVKKTHYLKGANESIVSPEDIDAWALEGAQKAIEDYRVDETDDTVLTYIANGARWNVQRELRHYRHANINWQDQADRLIGEASEQKGRDLTTLEEREILDTISPKFHEVYYSRKMGSTITSGALMDERLSQYPFADGSPELQYSYNDGMDRFVDGNALSSDMALDRDRLKKDVSDMLNTLTAREKKVIQMRFGIDMVDVLSFEESKDRGGEGFLGLETIGRAFDISRERVRQIEAKALRKLRYPSKSEHLRNYAQGAGFAVRELEDHEISAMEDEAFETFLELNAD